jgi:hypothetical protein
METLRLHEKTGKDGMLNVRIPLGKPDVECEIVVTVRPETDERGWPVGYFDLAGSITDGTFNHHPLGDLPKPVELEWSKFVQQASRVRLPRLQ